MANLYIIAGPNGAGKTTSSYTVLPEILNCREFVNADEIARGLSPFQPENVAIEAGRLMIDRIKYLIKINADFAFETTLSARSFVGVIKKAKESDYFIVLVYLWLNSQDLAVERVKARVEDGGHNIPEHVIRRRFNRGIENLFNLYMPISDFWMIINNSENPYKFVAEGFINDNKQIYDINIWNKLKEIAHGKE